MRRGTARHERSNLSQKSSGLLPEAEEAARIDQRIARYLARCRRAFRVCEQCLKMTSR
jgi:hypothetical protein